MLINRSTVIVGDKIMLVPYRKEHVLKYHEWMKSPELQQLTASEPLTLEQEFEMQQTWLLSDDTAMVGDTNLFLRDDSSAEAELMIAEPWARGQHRGWEAMLLMLCYGSEVLNIKEYEVKIGTENLPSIKMFQKMEFIECARSEVFQEITFSKVVDSQFLSWLREHTQSSISYQEGS